jgi:hypothetical protein
VAPKNADEDDQEPEKVAAELWVMGQAVSYDPLRVVLSFLVRAACVRGLAGATL